MFPSFIVIVLQLLVIFWCARLRPYQDGSVCNRDQENGLTEWSPSPSSLITLYLSVTDVGHIVTVPSMVPTRRLTPVQPLYYSTVRPELCLLGVTS